MLITLYNAWLGGMKKEHNGYCLHQPARAGSGVSSQILPILFECGDPGGAFGVTRTGSEIIGEGSAVCCDGMATNVALQARER